MWTNIKNWFHNSETIFLARLEALVGLLIAVGSSMDWSPLLSMNIDTSINWVQGAWLGGIMFVKGVITELARKRNEPTMNA